MCVEHTQRHCVCWYLIIYLQNNSIKTKQKSINRADIFPSCQAEIQTTNNLGIFAFIYSVWKWLSHNPRDPQHRRISAAVRCRARGPGSPRGWRRGQWGTGRGRMTLSLALSGQTTEQLLQGSPPKPHYQATFLIPRTQGLKDLTVLIHIQN